MNIPEKVVNRLTLYHFILDNLREDEQYISSTKIAQMLGTDNSQVRKDIKYLDNSGKYRVGYDAKKLKQAIEDCLGFKQKKYAFIVGAGNLGSALVKYDSLKDYGLEILAMFDNDPDKIGYFVNGKEVFDIARVSEYSKKLKVDFAILAVPGKYANKVALYLADSGIKYIWNFTPCILEVSKDVKVWNENLIGSFLQFIHNGSM